MIKANELRIGNYVNYKNKLRIVWEISQEVISISSSGHIAWLTSSDIKPIPLTEDWLLKFGFEKGFNTVPYFYKQDFYFQIYNYNEPSFLLKCCHCGVIHQTIKYVHQLQNLYFALTGEELTIKEQ